jgi:hypothetical protein
MEYYVGLYVSLKQTSICVVDQSGSVVREGVVDSDLRRSQFRVWLNAGCPHEARRRRLRAIITRQVRPVVALTRTNGHKQENDNKALSES